jgi:hypothetical protein
LYAGAKIECCVEVGTSSIKWFVVGIHILSSLDNAKLPAITTHVFGIEGDCVTRMSERVAYGDHEEQIGISFFFIESDCVSNTNFCGGRRENAISAFSKEPFALLSGEVSKPRSEQ